MNREEVLNAGMLSTLSKGCWNPLEFRVINPGSAEFTFSSWRYIQLLKKKKKKPQNNWSCWKVSRRAESERNIRASLQIPVRRVFQMPIPCQSPGICSLGCDKAWLEQAVVSHNLSEIHKTRRQRLCKFWGVWPKLFAFPPPEERTRKTPRKSRSCSWGGCKGLGWGGPRRKSWN